MSELSEKNTIKVEGGKAADDNQENELPVLQNDRQEDKKEEEGGGCCGVCGG